ncbi:anti-sigma factor [Cellulomonas aerilata]|uniref:Anti-sigma K factor RskA C-terminal domain-containing protein n=1 Tax=Cellulomonas aerilata TaxID=515326 RepID=A0A512D8C3_9CELL|nr:anti-sigma factor [Cellulomonas aerilata]GEO32657.1 hypothetical protein CAE01nite_03820 [Cellulomonas aerilata]
MTHVDPDALALVALGERPTAADAAHLAACPECAAEVASLAAVVLVGRSARDDAPVPAAPAVWDRIRDELGLPAGLRPVDPAARGLRTATAEDDRPGTPDAVPDTRPGGLPDAVPGGLPDGPPAPRLAPVVPLRRRSAPWVAAAAACGVVVGAAGGAWWAGRDVSAEPDVVAQAALDPLPGWDATGSARVEQAGDGERTLVVTLTDTEGDDGYHEVWLIDRDVTRLVSVGILTGSEGRFTVPPGLDLAEFPVVDVSDEPLDGDPAHSGDSIIRGVLDA